MQEIEPPTNERATLEGWVFADPPHTGVYTTRRVMGGCDPVTRVFHDSDDGAWQFHGPQESKAEDAVFVCLHCIIEKDATVNELADLPRGWCAWRDDVSSPWKRALQDENTKQV